MTTVSRQAFAHLMTQVEELEDQLGEKLAKVAKFKVGAVDKLYQAEQELEKVQEALRAKREELAKLSDGCGHGHHNH